jgi:chromosomal replication initiator protein
MLNAAQGHPAAERAWTECLNLIRDNVQDSSFSLWFQATKGLRLENQILTVSIPSQFLLDKVKNGYRELISRAVTQVLGEETHIDFHISPETVPDTLSDAASVPITPEIPAKFDAVSQLSPHYTFNNFVEGDGNQFAKAA